MSDLITCLSQRGLVEATTHKELQEIAEKPLKIYLGFDPTADSLHLGHLVGIVILSWCQKFGHTPYIILGGATACIGDPSGKSVERPLLEEEQIKNNIESIRRHFTHMLDFSGKLPVPVLLNNADWFSGFNLIEFLRTVGKHVRVGIMLGKESVRARLESEEGISFTEFSYQLLQAYDFYYLSEKHGVVMELGGSDQWGNIVAGIDLIRKLSGKAAFGLTFPLLTRSDGKKFGKTEGGAVWLSPEKFSPYQFYQYLLQIPDVDVIKMMKMLTFMPLEEIYAIEEGMKKSDYVPNSAQKRLAEEVTRQVHGESGLATALKVTSGAAPGSETALDAGTLEEIARDMPNCYLPLEEVVNAKLVDVMVKAGISPSKGEIVRLIKNGGVYLNNQKIEDAARLLTSSDLIGDQYILFSIGKKKKTLLSVKKA